MADQRLPGRAPGQLNRVFRKTALAFLTMSWTAASLYLEIKALMGVCVHQGNGVSELAFFKKSAYRVALKGVCTLYERNVGLLT